LLFAPSHGLTSLLPWEPTASVAASKLQQLIRLGSFLTGNADLGGTLAAITLLMALHWLLARAAAVSPRLSHLLEGRPVWLSQAGQIETSVLVRHGVSEAALNQALRSAGLEDASNTRLIVLEPSGKISVLKSPVSHRV
jgi:uncharacterized membrane protein YcaP (DUF421 family)